MATFLFDKIIFGPVISRRLGVSLGINLLPVESKYCNFDCIYCECGWSTEFIKEDLPSRESVKQALKTKLQTMLDKGDELDVITYAGNGEPTMHPDFSGIIDDTIIIRDELYPKARVAVLSNATIISKENIFNSLKKVDDNILKFDSSFIDTVNTINKPKYKYSIEKLIENLKRFNGKLVVQTMFLKGEYENKKIDNTTEAEVDNWLKRVKEIKPERVMIYTIARDTPIETLEKADKVTLDTIAKKVTDLGFEVQVSY